MGRLQSIEKALIEINETVFEELCGSFLSLHNANYLAFSRMGSQSGKQKTVKGTPDIFFLLPNDRYLFVECSTNITAGVSKLKADILKCLDTSKTGIEVNEIEEIILCTNFKIKPTEIKVLKKLLTGTNVKLTIHTLDSLSVELHLHHRDLVNHYLKLPFDSGQIVSITRFIKEYNKAINGIATPINNVFVHREKELIELANLIDNNDFTLVTGSAGVGKTKLCVEAITQYLNNHIDYSAYCIADKNHTLLDDLYTYLTDDKNYILFVDDANRIDRFGQITGFYKRLRTGKLKVVITVRDYAYERMSLLCQGFSSATLEVKKFDDEQIKDIIEGDPFKILNPKYQKEIFRVADGNPRLAIMASLLAKKEQNIAVLHNVGDLFNMYFSTFIQDERDFANVLNIKILGLIAFFNAIPFKDREHTEPLLGNFDISYEQFIDQIDSLEHLELVDIQFEYVKITEQNLATFFFYKAFVEDELLSFGKLLGGYFSTHIKRFEDTVIPANNNFGYEAVMQKLKPHLISYFTSISHEHVAAFKFLQTFWFYLQDETLEHVYFLVAGMDADNDTDYELEIGDNQTWHDQDPILSLLQNFLRFPQPNFVDALSLSFEYVRKKKAKFPELIRKLRDTLKFDFEDERYEYLRQKELFDFLRPHVSDQDRIYLRTFFELSKTFLNFQFRQTKAIRNNRLSIYQYKLKNTDIIKQFRCNLWTCLDDNYEKAPDSAFNVLKSYGQPSSDIVKAIMSDDITHVLKLIDNHLSPNSLEHCIYVQDLIRWFKKCGFVSSKLAGLKNKFTSNIYQTYLILDWNHLKDKEMHDFRDWEKYSKDKEADIRRKIKLKTKNEMIDFFSDFQTCQAATKRAWNYDSVLDIVADQLFDNSFELCLAFLGMAVDDYYQNNFVPTRVIGRIETSEQLEKFCAFLAAHDFDNQWSWKLCLYHSVDDNLAKEISKSEVLNAVNEIKGYTYIDLKKFARYEIFHEGLLSEICLIVYALNSGDEVRIKIFDRFFEADINTLNVPNSLIQEMYLQQFRSDPHYDHDGAALKNLTIRNPSFLGIFMEKSHEQLKNSSSGEHRTHDFVWGLPNIEEMMSEIFDYGIENEDYFGMGVHFLNMFFKGISEPNKGKAELFLLEYLIRNVHNTKRSDVIVNIARNSFRHMFEIVLLTYLEHSQDVSKFDEIFWRGNGGNVLVNADVNFGDEEAADWRNILEIVNKSKVGVRLIPIKKYINDRIHYSLQYADLERKRKFLGDD